MRFRRFSLSFQAIAGLLHYITRSDDKFLPLTFQLIIPILQSFVVVTHVVRFTDNVVQELNNRKLEHIICHVYRVCILVVEYQVN
jgi:ABC-type Na+ efflux pump permease subunit